MKDNKLIAEFMGLELEETLEGLFVYARIEQSPIKLNDIKTEFYEVHELQYHSSWDWLMPVVQKIGDDYYDTPFDETLSKLTEGYENIWTREDTYEAVVEFIKENNKYICGSCGDNCNEYTYNEETDVDECNQCKTINQSN
jgi:hypothetical protein